MESSHITIEKMVDLINNELITDKQAVNKHLIGCEPCKKSFVRLIQLHKKLNEALGGIILTAPSKTCLTEEEIANYPDSNLSKKELENIRKHVKSCCFCLIRIKLQHITLERKGAISEEVPKRVMDFYQKKIIGEMQENRNHKWLYENHRKRS